MRKEAGIDQKAGSLYAIDTQHAKTHEGRAFGIGMLFASVANGANADILIRVNASVEMHAEFAGASTGAAWAYLLEAAAVTGSGTEITAYNRYRESNNAVNGTFYHTPTLANTGTTLITTLIPGATNRKASGGGNASGRVEWILKPDTVYVMRLINKAGTGAMMSMNADIYEIDEDH